MKRAVSVLSGCLHKIPQAGGLQQRKLIFSQPWKLEVQDLGAPVQFWGELSSWGADGHLLHVSSRGREREQAVWNPSSQKHQAHQEDPTLTTSPNPLTSQRPYLKCHPTGGLGLQCVATKDSDIQSITQAVSEPSTISH